MKSPVTKIDSHHHFWSLDRNDYHWMPPSGGSAGPLREDYLPDRLAPFLHANNVVGTVLVQAAQTTEETMFLLGLASSTEYVLGVTGWVHLDSETAMDELCRLEALGPLVAIRPMLHDIADARWITKGVVGDNLAALAAHGQRFEILSYAEHLAACFATLEAIPNLPVVIDHLSKPRYLAEADVEWRHWMSRFAERPNTFCKLSGIVTEIGPGWTIADVEPVARFVIESFGPDRVMFGSDWPVCRQVAEYDAVVELADELISRICPDHASDIWFDSAARFYGLDDLDDLDPNRNDVAQP